MDNFFTWEILMTYNGFIATVYMVVEFTKEIKYINKIPTRYWSFFIAVSLSLATNIVMGTFKYTDILIYLLNSIAISLGSNGLSNFNKSKKEGIK